MSGLQEVRVERLKKLELLEARGIDPYPSKSKRTHTIEKALDSFQAIERGGSIITLAGRILIIRGQGAILFVDIQDGTGKIQAVLKGDTLKEESFSLFKLTIDNGDFIEVSGTVFVTNRGERSLLVEAWRILVKTLLPLPDKFHGLKDEEERYRKRYLDLLTRTELKELFRRKERFWETIRSFFKEHDFMEVETPTLELTTGGAEARPFRTHHNDFDIDVFLRISVGELWQKRLMSAGFDKTFEIGRTYRNEGTSPNHLQEFTNLEFYMAYADYEDGMRLVEELYRTIAMNVYGTTAFVRGEYKFDLGQPWARIDYSDEIKRQTGIDIDKARAEEIQKYLKECKVRYEGNNMERLTDTLWKYCRKNITGPTFLINHPKLVSPLAKSVPGKTNFTQRFQPIIAGTEVGNGYSELNNPIDQHARFAEQKELLALGDEEAMMEDKEFIEMLEHGMPPACGFGFGERLFAILENKPLRETQLFPLMRPKV